VKSPDTVHRTYNRGTSLARASFAALLVGCLCAPGCQGHDIVSGEIVVKCPSFAPGGAIPKRFAREPEGDNISPALTWSGVPTAAKELVLLVEDLTPDAPLFSQWVVFGIPASTTGIPEGIPSEQERAGGFVHGTNDFGLLGWGGPLPRLGAPTHTYWFWIYAIDTHLTLAPGAARTDVIEAMKSHILASGKMYGTYKR
jgi:Raf kinase inhibitor-like YbhB/YbcL family protein